MVNPFDFPEGYNFAFELSALFVYVMCLIDFLFITNVPGRPLDDERTDDESELIFYSFILRSVIAVAIAIIFSFKGVLFGWSLGIILTYLFTFYLDDLEDEDEGDSEEESEEDNNLQQ